MVTELEGKLNLISFQVKDVEEIVKSLGLELSEDRTILSDGKPVTCRSCGCIIKADNLGNIMHGSKGFYCDDPTCFAQYIAKYID